MGKFGAYLRLMRPINAVLMGFAVIVGTMLARGETLPTNFSIKLILGFITAFTLTGASMAINDYYDREIDAINEPHRPIPSGAVSTKEALFLAFVLSLAGFITSALTNASCLIIAAIAWIAFVTYTTKGKRTGLPGNFLVSLCVAIPLIYGSFVIAEKLELNIAVFAAIAFFSNTGREVTKGIVDVRGDRAQNIKTLAVVFGEKAAAITSVVFYLMSVGLSFLPWLLRLVSVWFIPFVLITDIGLIASSVSLLQDFSRENSRRIKNLVLIWLVTGLSAFFAGTFG